MRRFTYVLSLLCSACGPAPELRSTNSLDAARLWRVFGDAPIRLAVSLADGSAAAGCILVFQLERGGIVGWTLDSKGEVLLRAPDSQRPLGKLWVSGPCNSDLLGKAGAWRSNPLTSILRASVLE